MIIDVSTYTINEINIKDHKVSELPKVEKLYFATLSKFFLDRAALVITIGANIKYSLGYEIDHQLEMKVDKVKYLVNEVANCSSSLLKDISESEEFSRGLILLVEGEKMEVGNLEKAIKYIHNSIGLENIAGGVLRCESDGKSLRLYNMSTSESELLLIVNSV